MPGQDCQQISVVYKFGGSSVRDAARMREVADIVCSFPDELPCVVLSAMGKTTNNLLTAGTAAAALSDVESVVDIPALQDIIRLHEDTIEALGRLALAGAHPGRPSLHAWDAALMHEVRTLRCLHAQADLGTPAQVALDMSMPHCLGWRSSIRTGPFAHSVDAAAAEATHSLLRDLRRLLEGICILQDLPSRTKDRLVSFGERLSTTIFAGYLRSRGVRAKQVDAVEAGMVTTDDFTNAHVLFERALPALAHSLTFQPGEATYLPIFTGFIGRGAKTGAVTTLGRGGSDLTATVLGAALGLREVQVWKDVDGVLTTDPRVVPEALPVRELTYDEASELAYFGAQVLHPQAMYPAELAGSLTVRVKNSYNREAPGTVIRSRRDMSQVLVTSIVLKEDVTMMVISSKSMLGQFGFLAEVFDVFRKHRVSVDVVATSEVSVSITLDPAKIWERSLMKSELEGMVRSFDGLATVQVRQGNSIISLVANVASSSAILKRVFGVLHDMGINAEMISQGASMTNISLLVPSASAREAVKRIHHEFFLAPGPNGQQ